MAGSVQSKKRIKLTHQPLDKQAAIESLDGPKSDAKVQKSQPSKEEKASRKPAASEFANS